MSGSRPAQVPPPSDRGPTTPSTATLRGPRASKSPRRSPWRPRLPEGSAPWLLVLGAASIYATFLGYVCTLRYDDLLTFAYDLGNYNQIFWTTAVDHQVFFSTTGGPQGNGGLISLGHFTPVFFLLVPIYALAPGASALLYMQSAALAAGALPTYGLAKAVFRSERWGLLMAGAYLATPLTFWPTWYDFHPEVFFVAPILAAFYFLERRRLVGFLGFLLLGLMAIETIAPFLLAFCVLALLPSFYQRIRALPKEGSLLQRIRATRGLEDEQILLIGTFLCAVYLALSYDIALHASTADITFGATYDFWPQLAANTPYQVYPHALLHPGNAWNALMYDLAQKEVYVGLLLASLGFVPVIGPWRFTVPAYLWIGLAVLSANTDYLFVGNEYSCYVLPFLMAAAIYAVARVRRLWREYEVRRAARTPEPHDPASSEARSRQRWRRAVRAGAPTAVVTAGLLVGILATNAVANPLTANPLDLFYASKPGWPQETSHDAWEDRLIALIPPNAGVMTDATGFPPLSDRANAYVVPWQTTLLNGLTFQGLLEDELEHVSYLLLDWRTQYLTAALTLQDGNVTPTFGLEAAADGVYLWQRGYHGPLVLFDPLTYTFDGSNVTVGNAQVDPVNGSALGPSLYHPPGLANGTLIFTGLNLRDLAPGNYTVKAWIGVEGGATGPQLQLGVTESSFRIVAQLRSNTSGVTKYNWLIGPTGAPHTLTGTTVVSPAGQYVAGNATLFFSWNGYGYLEMEGWAASPGAAVRLYSLTLTQVNP